MPADYKLPSYTVYVDTSAVYSKKPTEPVSAKLLKWLRRARVQTSVDVRVPAVVLEELAYQQFLVAQAAAENLKKNSQTLMDVCGSAASQIPTVGELKAGARKIVLDAINCESFSLVSTPVEHIDWLALVDDSCWRHPPFEKPQSDDDLAEKGFRDKIVLETIKVDAARVSSGVIAFVAGDNLLRQTFELQVKTTCPVEVYRGFEELVGHLDLLAKTKSRKFTEAVLSRVAAVFYDANDPSCVALSQGVLTYLTAEHADEMARPPLFTKTDSKYGTSWGTISSPSSLLGRSPAATNWLEEWDRWTPVSSMKFVAAPPVFQPDKKDGRYHWISKLTLAQLLRRTKPRPGQRYGLPEERIRTTDVNVEWSCEINPRTAEFSNATVDKYIPALNDSFIEADVRSRLTYGLPIFTGADQTSSQGPEEE